MSEEKQIKIAKVKSIRKLVAGDEFQVHDFQISASDANGDITMVDFDFEVKENDEYDTSYEIKPGIWIVHPKSGLSKVDNLKTGQFFETDTSRSLLEHMNKFEERIWVYKKLKQKNIKRSLLLASPPGTGKSLTIRHFLDQNKDRPDICGLIIESGEANWELLTKMFSRVNIDESPIKLVVLVIEDIGGTELNERGSSIGSDMLNFLAGNSEAFKIPTLVIGTTNFINELGETLIDRPGRFDMLINVEPPKDSEVRLLIEPLLERQLTKLEEKALFGKGFTPAYCTEIVVRSMLYDISIEESAQQLEKQRENSQKKKHGKKSRSVGFDLDDD
jgi:SpoVK/Ycf46/Vps4 family AAA+-type ATPase